MYDTVYNISGFVVLFSHFFKINNLGDYNENYFKVISCYKRGK